MTRRTFINKQADAARKPRVLKPLTFTTQQQATKHVVDRLSGDQRPRPCGEMLNTYTSRLRNGLKNVGDGLMTEEQHHRNMTTMCRGLMAQAYQELDGNRNYKNYYNIAQMFSRMADWHSNQADSLASNA